MAENSLGVLVAEITARNDKFDAALKATEARLGAFEKNANKATSGVEKGFSSIAGVVSKAQVAFDAAQQSVFKDLSLLKQKTEIQAQVARGTLSAAAATQKMVEAETFARTGSRALAQELAATTTEYAKAAAAAQQVTASTNAVVAGLRRQQDAAKSAQQSGFQDLSLLKQKIAIQEQVIRGTLSAAAATQRMAEANIFAATGSRALAKELAATRAEFERNASAIKKLEGEVAPTTSAFSRLQSVVAAVAASLVVRKIIEYADAAKLLEGRVRLVTGSQEELLQVQDALFTSAQRTRVSYESTVDLYTRLARNSKELGASQRVLLQVTETVNKAVQLSGVTAASAGAALVQLGQGFASGTLRGEELNSIMEQTPRLAEAIATGMKITIGQLRALGQTGALSGKAVFDALQSQRKAIDEEFSRLPITIGQSLTQIQNSLLDFVGSLDATTSSTSRLAEGIHNIGRVIDLVSEKVRSSTVAEEFRAVMEDIDQLEKKIAGLETLPNWAVNFFGDLDKEREKLQGLTKRANELANQLKGRSVEGVRLWEITTEAFLRAGAGLDELQKKVVALTPAQEKLRDMMRSTKSAVADFNLNIAQLTGDLDLFRQASLDATNAKFSTQLEKAAGNADLIAEIEAQKALATKQLLIDGTTFFITKKQEELLVALSVEQGKANAAEAGLSAQRTSLVATQQRIQAESELAEQATDKTARYLVLQQQSADITQKLAVLEAQAAAASNTATQRRIDLANGLITVLQTQLAQQQQLAQGGDNTAAANAAQLQKSIQGLVTERDKDIAAALKQGSVHAAAMQTIETTSLKAAQVMGKAFLATYDKITEATKRRIALQESAFTTESAGLSKQAKQSQSVLSILQAELKILQARGGTYEKQLEIVERINKQEKELITIALQRMKQELAAAKVSVTNAELLSAQLRDQIEIGKQQGIDVTELTQKYTELEIARLAAWANVTEVEGEVIEAETQVKTAAIEAGERIRDLNKIKLDEALLTVNDLRDGFRDVIRGVFEGSGDIDDVIKNFGKGMGLKLIEGIAFGKEKLEDQVLIPNFSELFGGGETGVLGGMMKDSGMDLGSIFGKFFGQSASSSVGDMFKNVQASSSSTASGVGQSGFDLGSIFGKMFGQGAQSGMFSNVQASSSSTAPSAGGGGFMSMFSGMFGGMGGTGGASGAGTASGSAWGSAFGYAAIAAVAIQAGKDFSNGKYGSGGGAIVGGAIGAYFSAGNPQITALAAQIGGMLGGLLDPLFKHEPTSGTQIRTKVKKFLKEIEVSFSDEIDKDEYFFEETKKLAKKMFGGDFLEASKSILTTKAGPELAKQLQALGTIITAKWAQDRNKDVEQTGTTFGNMLIDNLGIDEIPDAIKEIVDKANISFEGLTERLTELFDERKVISAEFYKTTIEGAVSLFFGDLPDAINVSKLALQSFTEKGLFDLEIFQKKVKETTDKFGLVAQSFSDAIKNSKSGEEAAKMFGEQLKKGLEDLAIDKFIQDFIDKKLFIDIDLSDGLDSKEIELLKERTRLARIEVDKLRTSLGDIDASELVDQIRELNKQLEELAQKRIQIRIELIQQLTQIGSLTNSESIALQMKEFAVLVEQALAIIKDTRIGRSGDTALQHTPDVDLQSMFDALGRMADLTVQQFQEFQRQREAALQAEIQAIQTALSAKIAAIQEELAAHITAIQNALTARLEAIRKEYDARREKIQASMDKLREEEKQTREVFQARLDALEKELQLAQEFKALAESLQQTINGLVLSTSALSGPEQLAFLQRQADELRGRIKKALPEDRPELIQQLSQILQSQLQEGQGFLDPVAFAQLFQKIVTELQTLRDGANEEGKKAVDIQEKIAAATREMEAALKAIQARMEALQKLLEQLTQDENNAIAAAQKAAAAEIAAAQAAATIAITAAQDAAAKEIAEAQRKAAEDITEEQKRTEVRLIELAKARDDILKEQMARIVEQREILKEQLIKQFGKEEAERLLAEPMIESVRHLITIHDTLVGIEDLMFKFINDENSGGGDSDSNASTMLSSPSALLPNQSAIVSPPPQGFLPSGNSTVTVNYTPTFNVNVPPSGSIEEDTRRLLSAVKQQTMDDVRTGTLGQEIVKQVRGRMGVGI